MGFAKSIAENGLNKNKSIAGLLILENTPMRVCLGNKAITPNCSRPKKVEYCSHKSDETVGK